MIAEDGEYGADTLVHSLQADGAVGQLRTSLTHRVVLALLSGKNKYGIKKAKPFQPPIKNKISKSYCMVLQDRLTSVTYPHPVCLLACGKALSVPVLWIRDVLVRIWIRIRTTD
jgi:hypothetical protein